MLELCSTVGFIQLPTRIVSCRNAISSCSASIMRSNMLRSMPAGMRLYFATMSESAFCRLRRSLSVLSMKSSMWVITAARGSGSRLCLWLGVWDVYVPVN